MKRRRFIQSLSALTASFTSLGISNATQQTPSSDTLGEILPLRLLGKTGKHVTMLGLGGAHVSSQFSDRGAQQLIEAAIEGGIRFFDTARTYNNGLSEELYGKYLTPKYRSLVFLMTKAHLSTAGEVRKQLDDSLLKLKTDYLDLWQMHQVMSPDDVDDRIARGVLDVFIQAKESGKVRHIGFTGHRMPEAHLRVLEKTDIFETCQMPVNCADPSYGSFILNVMPKLIERDMGIIAMKTLACGGFFGGTTWFQGGNKPKICPDRMTVKEAIHFVWSLPVSVLVTGPNSIDQLKEKIEFANTFMEMSEETRSGLIDRAADLTARGGVEFYKDPNLSAGCDWMMHT